MGKIKYQAAFFFLIFFPHILKMVARRSFHFFGPLCCPCFLNTDLSHPGPSKVHVPHLEAWKRASLCQHHYEGACPAQGGSAGAMETFSQFLWSGKCSGAEVAGVTGHARQQHDAPSMSTVEPVFSVVRPLVISKDLSQNLKHNNV